MANEYPDFGGKWEVIRAANLIQQLKDEGKIKSKQSETKKKRVVYHDSCYYARFNGVVEEPRKLLDGLPGVERLEMKNSGKTANCCGAGGGRMWMEEDKDKRVNVMRAREALEQKPDIIATSCPFCKIMLTSAINEEGLEGKVKVLDVMEVVSDSQ